jgi:nitroreductase
MAGLTNLPITDIIKKRKSWRTYTATPVETEKKEQILQFIANLNQPPFGSAARFELVDLDLKFTGKVAGTYGVIKGAETFITAVVNKGPGDMEDVGYLFEQIILFATAIGLDTCWMGASFSRELFAEKITLKPDETLPVVSPIGYRAGRRSLTDMVFHMSAGSKNRKPWPALFFHSAFNEPLDKSSAGKLEMPLEMVRLAPSAVNKQPWRLVADDAGVHFFLKRTAGFKSMFTMDLQRIDMGIAMCHFELAADIACKRGRWKMETPDIPSVPNDVEYIASWKYLTDM